MSWYTIPFTPGDTNPTFPVTLEGVQYVFSFWYNTSENVYYLSIGDPNAAPGVFIISSIKLHTNKPLIARYAGAAAASCAAQGTGFIWPPGELLALTVTNNDAIAGLGDLGARVQLFYVTSGDPALTPAVT
jgi:hypothetical protein